MNEWNNDPIEILSFVNIDDIMESIFRKNIETHLIIEQLETDMNTNAVIIGSFQPFHNGHLSLVQEALTKNDRVSIIAFTEKASIHSPWSHQSNLNVIINSDHDDYEIIQVGDKTFQEGYDILQWEGIRKLTTRVDAYLERLA